MSEDKEIVMLFFTRSQQAIEKLSEKYGLLCNSLAKNILKNERDAEECVNDTYLAVWNTIPPKKPEKLKPYVLRIVRNIAITRYHSNTALKRNSHYDTAFEELEGCFTAYDTVESEISAKELSELINRFLNELDEESQMIFVRRYWYSDSISEISKRFKISNNNVSVKLSRLRTKLKKYLEKENYEI